MSSFVGCPDYEGSKLVKDFPGRNKDWFHKSSLVGTTHSLLPFFSKV